MDSNTFRKLPGQPPRRAAAGLERVIWRRLPALAFWGTLLPALLGLARHLWADFQGGPADPNALLLGDYTLIAIVVLHWTLLLTVAIGCIIVYVMKGPAYVADGYNLPERDGAAAAPAPAPAP